MAEDFTAPFPYGLSDLPAPPPDDFNPLDPPNDLASIGMQRLGGPQVVQAGFRLPRPRPLGPYPVQGGLAPGGGQLPEIPIPYWWKKLGPLLQILPRIGNGPGVGSGKEELDCDEEWRVARADCARALAKPFPSKGLTGGYTNVEDCARGLVPEACAGGNPVDWGPQENPPHPSDPPRKNKKR